MNSEELTLEELIAEATDSAGITMAEVVGVEEQDLTADDALQAALETLAGDGTYGDELGDVNAYGFHVYQIGRWTLYTNEQGQKKVTDHGSEKAAVQYMDESRQYML